MTSTTVIVFRIMKCGFYRTIRIPGISIILLRSGKRTRNIKVQQI